MHSGRILALAMIAGCAAPDEAAPPPTPGQDGTSYEFDDPLVELEPTFDIGGCCYVHIEAESFDGWRTQTNITPFHGIGFLTSGTVGTRAATIPTLDVAFEPGTYFVWVRSYQDRDDRSFEIEVGEQRLPATHGPAETPGYSWQRAGEAKIEGGVTRLRLHDAGGGVETPDAIVFTTNSNIDPAEEEQRFRIFDPSVAEAMVIDELVDRAARYHDRIPIPIEADEWTQRSLELRPQLLRALGLDPLPESTPLNAQLRRTITRDGYRIEVIAFESRPGMLVTANVFVPDGPGPFPLVISPLGHGLDKRSTLATARNHRLAELGYITIIYDPFGQGERDVRGNAHAEHWRLGLSGRSNMTIMVWDSVRALDYMLSRSDVDPTRVAVTGYSGGGLNTLYFAGIDERLDVAVPASYVTSFEAFLATGIGHDPCTYVPSVGGFTDMGEVVSLFAPKPYLVLSGSQDASFPVAGARDAIDLAQPRYRLAGDDTAIAHDVFDVGHTYDRQMREAMYGFVSRSFMGTDGAPIDEGTLTLPEQTDAALNFHTSGRVPTSGTEVSELARTWALETVQALPDPTVEEEALRSNVVALLGERQGPSPTITSLGMTKTPFGFEVEALTFEIEPGVVLPAFLYRHGDGAPLVVLTDAASIADGAPLDEARRAGASALYVAVRGRGESSVAEAWQTAGNYLLGDPLAALRAYDLAQIRRGLRTLDGLADRPAALIATGAEASVEALFAQAIYGEYEAATIGPIYSTWMDLFGRSPPWSMFVFGILEVADIPQLAYLAGVRPLRLEFSTTQWRTHHARWFEALNARVQLEDQGDLREQIEWAIGTMGY